MTALVFSLLISVLGLTDAEIAQAQSKSGAAKKSLADQAAQFENRMCGVNPNRTLFRNVKREETVLFYLNHTPRNTTPLADFLTSYKTKSARAAAIKQVIDANYAQLRSFDEVDGMLGDRMLAKKLDWVGIEKASDEIDPTIESELFKVATTVETQLKKDKVKPKDLKSFLVLQMGPVLHFRWKNEQLRRTTRLVALDDVTIRMKSRAYIESKDEKATTLLKAVPGSGIRTSDMERIIDISQVSLFSGVKERTPELLTLMAKIKKPEVKKLVEEYRVWIEQGVDSLVERDTNVAKTILAQTGMGLLLLSANFGPGVSEQLMNSCPNNAGKSAR